MSGGVKKCSAALTVVVLSGAVILSCVVILSSAVIMSKAAILSSAVILSVAKDLVLFDISSEILRFAQDDML